MSISCANLRIVLVCLLQLRGFLQRIFELDIQRRRHHFCDAIHIAVRHVHGPTYVFDRRLCRHGAEGDDLRDVFPSIFLRDVVDHFAAPVHAEINVDIRHGDALRIQKALKKQFVLQRIDVGDAKRIRNQRSSRRTAARAHRNLCSLA